VQRVDCGFQPSEGLAGVALDGFEAGGFSGQDRFPDCEV
jgi:hypothetical protein